MRTSPSHRLPDLASAVPDPAARVPLIVFSPLRWDAVVQRPQQLMAWLAQHFDVYVVEEPVYADGEPALMSATHEHAIEVLTPRTDVVAPGFHDHQRDVLRALLAEFVVARGLHEPIVWLYSPMALPLVADLEPRALVYDCMDDLASSRFTTPELAAREAALIELADVVLTNGPSLHAAFEGRSAHLHGLPNAVDAARFAPENLDGDDLEARVAAEIHRGLARPRLGFFGVIDERIDLALVAGIADRRPDWQIVMAGPVVGLSQAALPRCSNIHWTGPQRHEALPHLMSHWDACMLPFVVDKSTRFINPIETLEHLAGGKPVVGTPLHDLVSLHGSAVCIAQGADEFVAAVQELLGEGDSARAHRRLRARALVNASTWEGAAASVAALLQDYCVRRPAEPVVLHQRLVDPMPRIRLQPDLAAIPLLTDRIELPASPLTL